MENNIFLEGKKIGIGKNHSLFLIKKGNQSKEFTNTVYQIKSDLEKSFKREFKLRFDAGNGISFEIDGTPLVGYIGHDFLFRVTQDHLDSIKATNDLSNLYEKLMSENEIDNVLKRYGFEETNFNTVIQLPERNMSTYKYFYKENKSDCTYSTIEIKQNSVVLCFYCIENSDENMNKLNSNNGIFESIIFLN